MPSDTGTFTHCLLCKARVDQGFEDIHRGEKPAEGDVSVCPVITALNLVSGGTPADLRELGWSVAVHNDYRSNGEPHTFWLLTNGDRCVKGEGKTDAEALELIRQQLHTHLELSPLCLCATSSGTIWNKTLQRFVCAACMGRSIDEPVGCTVGYLRKGHAGDGWYYWDTEYPEEGVVGVYDSATAAWEAAQGDYDRLDEINTDGLVPKTI